ncbi:MAG: hypothetical protein KAV00_09135 [Phycisphaerae bacterium]|nr:hypothetical protein [Phycisphaerae bacterium]
MNRINTTSQLITDDNCSVPKGQGTVAVGVSPRRSVVQQPQPRRGAGKTAYRQRSPYAFSNVPSGLNFFGLFPGALAPGYCPPARRACEKLRCSITLSLCVAAILTVAASAAADSIKLTSGITHDSVKIVGVSDGTIRFLWGKSTLSKPVSKVAFINITDDGNFTKGENLLGQGKYAEAEKAYSSAQRTATKWKKTLIDYRLLAVSNAAGHIDKSTARWLKIVDDACRESSNRTADVSAGVLSLRPKKLAPPKSKANDRAITLLNGKIKETKSDAYVKAIRELLVDLYECQGQLAKARAEAMKLAGKTPTSKPSGGTKTLPVGSANVQLRLASLSMKEGQFDKVIELLQPRMKQFAAPELPTAMLLLGKAKLEKAKAESKKPASRKLLIEAGLDLMRVAVFFTSSSEAPHALLLAGEVNERLGNNRGAKAAYSAVVRRYAKSPAAKEAKKALERMKK